MTEARIQTDIVRWFTNTYCLKHQNPRSLILSVPNGGTRNPIEAMGMKAQGLLPGASDLIVIHNRTLIWVEVKAENGKQSAEQVEFETRVKAQGYQYIVIRSLEAFKATIDAILHPGGYCSCNGDIRCAGSKMDNQNSTSIETD